MGILFKSKSTDPETAAPKARKASRVTAARLELRICEKGRAGSLVGLSDAKGNECSVPVEPDPLATLNEGRYRIHACTSRRGLCQIMLRNPSGGVFVLSDLRDPERGTGPVALLVDKAAFKSILASLPRGNAVYGVAVEVVTAAADELAPVAVAELGHADETGGETPGEAAEAGLEAVSRDTQENEGGAGDASALPEQPADETEADAAPEPPPRPRKSGIRLAALLQRIRIPSKASGIVNAPASDAAVDEHAVDHEPQREAAAEGKRDRFLRGLFRRKPPAPPQAPSLAMETDAATQHGPAPELADEYGADEPERALRDLPEPLDVGSGDDADHAAAETRNGEDAFPVENDSEKAIAFSDTPHTEFETFFTHQGRSDVYADPTWGAIAAIGYRTRHGLDDGLLIRRGELAPSIRDLLLERMQVGADRAEEFLGKIAGEIETHLARGGSIEGDWGRVAAFGPDVRILPAGAPPAIEPTAGAAVAD